MPATEVDLRTIDTYFEPSSFVLSKEKSGEVKPKIKPKVFRVITDNNLRLNGGRFPQSSSTPQRVQRVEGFKFL